MWIDRVVATLSSVALAAGFSVPGAAASERVAEPVGLWSTDFVAAQSKGDCGEWQLDKNDFCVANDARNGLELGLRFQSSTALTITGIRIYRADPAELRASLWDAAGTLLAQGSFAADGGDHGWQDMIFGAPVTIAAGTTYVASYFTPATKYAFSYGYFADAPLTVGPVTARPSTETDPNGVHCYDDEDCGSFPVHGYKHSSYWVTPLWLPPPDGTTPSGPAAADSTPPRVTSGAPADKAKRVRVDAKLKVTFSEPVRRASLTRATVRLLPHGKAKRVVAKLKYDADRRRVSLLPKKTLRASTTYRVQITTGVLDTAGNRLDQSPTKAGHQDATWTFRTR